MDRMNVYAVCRGADLRALARHADFDAPFEVVHTASRIEQPPFQYRIAVDVYRCISPDGVSFARIGQGFFFNIIPSWQRGETYYPVVEDGVLYITPKYFNAPCNLDWFTRDHTSPNLIPPSWKEERVDYSYFGGDPVILYGQRYSKFYGIFEDYWNLRDPA